jgi:hypothetical protein
MRAGSLSFGEEGPRLSGASPAEREDGPSGDDRAYSGIPCPIPGWAEAEPASPLRLKAEPIEGGLRLTLSNEGAKPLALDPVALDFVCAEFTPVTVKGVPGGPKEFTYLKLEFGILGGWERWCVPARELKVLAKGQSHSWDVAILPEHRDAGHVSIEFFDRFRVEGPCAAPLLRRLGWSWAR